MIKQIKEDAFVETFFDLMAEVECGDHFDPLNTSHVEWLRKRISIHYFRGACFYAYYRDGKKFLRSTCHNCRKIAVKRSYAKHRTARLAAMRNRYYRNKE